MVAIDVARLYWRPQRIAEHPQTVHSLKELLFEYQDLPVIWGYAVTEASWGRFAKRLNDERRARLTLALETVFSWTTRELAGHFRGLETAHAPAPIASQVNDAAPQISPFSVIAPSYALLLKLQTIQRARSTDGVRKYRQFMEWMATEMKFIGPYEKQLAFDCFLGERRAAEYVAKLLKFGSSDLLSATWTAAWDLTHIRAPDTIMLETPGLEPMRTSLVTADKGLIPLRDRCRLVGTVNNFPVLATNIEIRPEYATRAGEVADVEAAWTASQIARFDVVNHEELLENVQRVITELENELSNLG